MDSVHIEVIPPMQAIDDEASTCQGVNVELNVIQNDVISEGYDVTSHLIGNSQQGTATLSNHWLTCNYNSDFSGQDTLYYYLKVGDTDEFNDTARIIISVIPTDIHILSTSLEEFCNAGFAELAVVSDLPNILWSTGETTASITVNKSGTYSVTTSGGGCTATTNTTIPTCSVEIYLPNCFTPSDEDGINDFFYLNESIQSQIDNFEIVIYSRWGEAVFSSVDKGFKWDGKYNGRIQAGETFIYCIWYNNNLGQRCLYKGNILVL